MSSLPFLFLLQKTWQRDCTSGAGDLGRKDRQNMDILCKKQCYVLIMRLGVASKMLMQQLSPSFMIKKKKEVSFRTLEIYTSPSHFLDTGWAWEEIIWCTHFEDSKSTGFFPYDTILPVFYRDTTTWVVPSVPLCVRTILWWQLLKWKSDTMRSFYLRLIALCWWFMCVKWENISTMKPVCSADWQLATNSLRKEAWVDCIFPQ